MAWIVRSSKVTARRRIMPRQDKSAAAQVCVRQPFDTGSTMQRRNFLKRLAISASLAAAGMAGSLPAFAADTIKVGVLHSLSGTMAISETVLKDVTLMAIDEINAKGGVMGKKLEAVVVDPASNWPLFAEKARQLPRPISRRFRRSST